MYRYGGDSSPSEALGTASCPSGASGTFAAVAAPTATSKPRPLRPRPVRRRPLRPRPLRRRPPRPRQAPPAPHGEPYDTASPSTTSSPSITVARTATITVPLSGTSHAHRPLGAVTGPTVAAQAPTARPTRRPPDAPTYRPPDTTSAWIIMLGVVLIGRRIGLSHAAHLRQGEVGAPSRGPMSDELRLGLALRLDRLIPGSRSGGQQATTRGPRARPCAHQRVAALCRSPASGIHVYVNTRCCAAGRRAAIRAPLCN